MSGPRIRHVAELARQWVEEGTTHALVVLAARRGRIVLHEAFGSMTPDANSPPVPLDALFDTASVGKVVTAAALMILVEEGRVGLNRPISGYIPEFRGEGKDAVLIRHLLTHTSGLREEDVETYAKENQGKVDIPPAEGTLHPLLNEFFALRYGCPLWKPAGQEMSYLPFGFELIGEVVRRVSGEPLDRFAEKRIFQPLGMKDTSYCPVDLPRERLVPPMPVGETDPFDEARKTERVYYGSGGNWTTAKDLAIFGQMFLNGGAHGDVRVLSPATVEAMTRNQIPGIGAKFRGLWFPEALWGLGWSVHGSKASLCGGLYSPESYEHSGAGGIYCWIDPKLGVVGVYLSSVEYEMDPYLRLRTWRNDLFEDAVTAAVVEP